MSKHKYGYTTDTDKQGNEYRYRTWIQVFKDEDTGETHPIKRHTLIKVNGIKVRFYSNAELKQMTPAQRKAVKLPLKSTRKEKVPC